MTPAPLKDHLHIITAGTDIFPAYVRALRDHDDITGTIVVADPEIYTINSREEKAVQLARERTRNAVAKVRAHAAALKIPVSFVFVRPPIMDTARDALLTILKEHPGALLSFDLSGGSKDLGIILFYLTLWTGATIHFTLPGKSGMDEHLAFAEPGISVAAVGANRNYLRVLESLAREPEKAMEEPLTGMSRSYLYNQAAAFYVPKRTRGVKPGAGNNPDLHDMSQGTFSNILKTMASAGLIEESSGPNADRKRTKYRITAAGSLALRLAQIQSGQPRVT